MESAYRRKHNSEIAAGNSIISAVVIPGDQFVGPAERHSHGANAVFCDGHVEWTRTENWNSATDKARRRWNNDHEPHPETW